MTNEQQEQEQDIKKYKEMELDRFLAECQNEFPDFSDFDADDLEDLI